MVPFSWFMAAGPHDPLIIFPVSSRSITAGEPRLCEPQGRCWSRVEGFIFDLLDQMTERVIVPAEYLDAVIIAVAINKPMSHRTNEGQPW